MPNLSNDALNELAHTNYSDEFLNMMRKWYSGDLHNQTSTELILKNIGPDNAHGSMYEYISKHVPVKGSTVLEIGCGSGQNAEAWHRAGAAEITALDIDEFPVTVTKQRCKELGAENTNIFHADFIKHEFDRQFDIVNCVQVIEHVGVENQESALKKLLELTKKNGIVFLQIPNKSCVIDSHDSRLPFAHWLPRRIGASYAKLFGRTPPTWDPMSYGRVKKIIEDSGGEVLNKIDMCDNVAEFLDYRINKRRSVKNTIFAGIVLAIYPFLRGDINAILPNINMIVRKVA